MIPMGVGDRRLTGDWRQEIELALGGLNPMRAFRAAITSVSTTWAAADHSRIWRAIKITASVVVTTAVVALASFVAVALSLT